jgi:hypothetical protein
LLLLLPFWGCGARADYLTTSERTESYCFASCDAQAEGCSTLDLAACRDLCTWTVRSMQKRIECQEAAIDQWRCDARAVWACSPDTNVVARREPASACLTETETFESLDCIAE